MCDPDDILLVLPSDHIIKDLACFKNAANFALELAKLEYLVTFEVKPSHPETGYGYIQRGSPIADGIGYVIHDFE